MGWLSETGRVVALENDAVWVEADRSAACGKCSARAGCGQGALSALLQSGKGRVRAISGDKLAANDCQVGDAVVIQVPESTLLMLVSALSNRDNILAAYQHAVANQYRFFSYGDAMLVDQLQPK